MPQIARLLSAPGAINQQGGKPNVENTAIAAYAEQLKQNPLLNTVTKSPTKIQPSSGSIFNKLLGSFGLGKNKATARLGDIFTLLQKVDERKERDYQVMYLQREIQKEKDINRHKEIVSLFVKATKLRKKDKRYSSRKRMAGGLGSTLFLAGGAVALLALGKDAVASMQKDITSELETEVEKEFQNDEATLLNLVTNADFDKEYDNLMKFFENDYFKQFQEVENWVNDNLKNYFSNSDAEELKKFDDSGKETLDQLERNTTQLEKLIDDLGKSEQEKALDESRRVQGMRSLGDDTYIPNQVSREAPAGYEESVKTSQDRQSQRSLGAETPRPPVEVSPITPTSRQPFFVREPQSDLVRRAAALTAEGEVGATEKTPVKQIVNEPNGTKSYGLFGLNTKGELKTFVEMYPHLGLQNVTLGSKEFDVKWLKLDAEELRYAQMDYYAKKVVNPIQAYLQAKFPPDIANDPRVIMYMADRRIQQYTVGLDEAISYAQGAKTPEEFIRKMAEFDKNPENIKRAFSAALKGSKDPEGFLRGLINRVNLRERKSLNPESVNTNILGSILNNSSIQFSDLMDSFSSTASSGNLLLNNQNVVTQKRVSISVDPMHNAHPLVG